MYVKLEGKLLPVNELARTERDAVVLDDGDRVLESRELHRSCESEERQREDHWMRWWDSKEAARSC